MTHLGRAAPGIGGHCGPESRVERHAGPEVWARAATTASGTGWLSVGATRREWETASCRSSAQGPHWESLGKRGPLIGPVGKPAIHRTGGTILEREFAEAPRFLRVLRYAGDAIENGERPPPCVRDGRCLGVVDRTTAGAGGQPAESGSPGPGRRRRPARRSGCGSDLRSRKRSPRHGCGSRRTPGSRCSPPGCGGTS